MDLCHCDVPELIKLQNKQIYCNKCNLWYSEKEWLEDTRKLGIEVYGPNLKIGRNDYCPCGSGKKFKFCCLNKKKYE